MLLGILALQMDFIGRDALIQAMHAWVLDKVKPLGQVLVEQGALSAARRPLLEPLVEARSHPRRPRGQRTLRQGQPGRARNPFARRVGGA